MSHRYQYILLLVFILVDTGMGYSQIVINYKETLPEKRFDEFQKTEALANENADDNLKAQLFWELGTKALRYSNDLSLEYLDQSEKYFKQLKEDSLYHFARSFRSLPLINRGKYDEAASILNEVLIYWKEIKDEKNEAEALMRLGFLERQKGNYVKALDYHQASFRIKKRVLDKRDLGDIVNRILITYRGIGDCESALKYSEEFLSYVKEPGWYGMEGTVMFNSIPCHESLGHDSIVREYKKQTSKMWLRSSSFKLKALGYSELGYMALDSSDFKNAFTYLDSCLYFAKKSGITKSMSNAEEGMHDYYVKVGQKDKAFYHLNNALKYAIESNYITHQASLYNAFKEHYESLGDYKKALFYFQKSDSINKVIFSEDVANEIKQLDSKIQMEQSEEEMQMLEEQNRLKEINLSNEKRIKSFLLFLLIGALLFLALLYALFRLKSKSNKNLSQKNEIISNALDTNKMLVKEIHHRVKNNLQVVSSLLFLQSRYMDDDSAKGAIKIGRARVQAMSLLHQKLYQKDNLQSVNLKAYFLDLGQNLFDTYQLKDHNIEFVTDIDDFEFDIDTLVPLGLITNELISNALKHAFSEDQHGWIKLSIKKHGAKIHLQVADNGKGIGFTEIPQNSKSLGMELVKSFAEKLGAELKIENKEGSVFTLIFDADRNKFK